MIDLPPVLQALVETRNLAADDVLLSALAELEQPYNLAAVDVLLLRKRDAALERLLEQYHELPEACRSRIADQAECMEGALRAALRSSNETARLNALDMAAHRGSPSLLYLLSAGLSSPSSTVRGRAAAVLRDMAVKFAEPPPWDGDSDVTNTHPEAYHKRLMEQRAGRTLLAEAIVEALHCFDVHRRTAVLEAAGVFSLDLEDELLAEARKPRSKYWRAICEMIHNDPRPGFAALALQALAVEESRPTIVQALSQCQSHTFMTAVMGHSWLVSDPRIRAGCARIRRLAWLEQQPPVLLEMPADLLRRTLRFLSATAIAAETKIGWYRSLLECGRPDQQLAALWGVVQLDHPACNDLLRILADWADPEIAELARRELFRRNPSDPRLQNIKRQSAPGPHQRIVPPDHCDFDWFQKEYDHLDEEQRSAVGRGLLAAGVDLVGKLSSMLKSADPACRVRAMDMMRSLGLEDRLAEQLIEAAHDADCVVRSAVVKALARLRDRGCERILIRALEDPDRRVRANAIEALDELRCRDCVEKIAACLTDEDHRVRAAAVKALLKLRVRGAAQALLELLHNPSRMHRLSGLWVVEKYGLAGALKQVAELAENDPDERVRRRARRLLRLERRAARSRPSLPAPARRGPQQ